MKYMILLYGSQQDYAALAGRPSDKPAWSPQDFAAMGAFMEEFNRRLVGSGELVDTRGCPTGRSYRHDKRPRRRQLPSQYLATGDQYRRYQVNISSGQQ